MKLRGRIALATALLTVPLAVVTTALDEHARARSTADVLQAHLQARIDGDGLTNCRKNSWIWSRPNLPPPPFPPPPGAPPPPPMLPPPSNGGPPIEVIAYDENGTPSAPPSPPIDRAMLDASKKNGSARSVIDDGNQTFDAVALRTSVPSGPCSVVVARRPRPPFAAVTIETVARAWLPPLLAMLVAVALAVGPIVRRIRRLGGAVRTSARDRYRTPIALGGDDEIAELAGAFDEAAREVRTHLDEQEKREQTLRDFLANTTHDVMTPLTVLQGHLSTMRRIADEGRPIDDALVGAAIDEAHYMAALVHNLGVAARLEAGEPHVARAKVDLGALVERVVLRHRSIAKQHEISVDHAIPEERVIVEGDETFLEQAASNVVYNAVRHNAPGGHVAVVLEKEGERFRLRVLDDGPGVSAHELATIADRNVRGEAARTRHPDGRGLGLAITKRVCALHDVELTFAPAAPHGLEVTMAGKTIAEVTS